MTLNSEALEAAADALAAMYKGPGTDEPFHSMATTVVQSYLAALPSGDLVERLLKPVTLSGMNGSVEVYQRVIVERAEAAARIQELEQALKPWASHDWSDDIGWNNRACQNDRICDWFGPSDFRAARAALNPEVGE